MKILVMGGAGFIGANLCRRLLEGGHVVTCMDDLSTGTYANVMGMLENSRFSFVIRDVREPFDIEVDRIYDLACPASPVHYQEDPVRTAMTSVLGAKNALDLAVARGARVLLSSTSEIYGEPMVHPQIEDYRGNVNPIGIRACYDEGKRMAETLFFDYARTRGADIRVVRIFNTYGPYMSANDGRVVSNFIVQALKGEDITVYGDGSQTRSFCYVDDLVDGLVLMMENDRGFTGPVNLGNPAEESVLGLAGRIVRITGSSSGIVNRDLPDDDPTRRCPDISLAGRMLGWAPKVPIDEGLARTAAYFRDLQLHEEDA